MRGRIVGVPQECPPGCSFRPLRHKHPDRLVSVPEPGTTCAAFLLCGRPATTWLIPEATPPGFDRVPACDRCAEKMKRIAGV